MVNGGITGDAGYGVAFTKDTQWTDGNSSSAFAFAPGIYSRKDRQNNLDFCLNPSTSAAGVKYSTWENYLYDQSTGQRVTYENPGFYLKSNLSGQTVGDVSNWGVNFWNEASSADQLDGSVLINVADNTSYTLKKRLRDVCKKPVLALALVLARLMGYL